MQPKDKRAHTSPLNGVKGGVKTDEGKEISSLNSHKHGIFSVSTSKLDDCSFDDVYEKFAAEYGESTPTRSALICQLTLLWIRLRRCVRFETEFIREKLDPPVYEQKLVKKGLDLDFPFGGNEYETVLTYKGSPITLSPEALAGLENLYFKYEGTFLRRFCQIINILTQSTK